MYDYDYSVSGVGRMTLEQMAQLFRNEPTEGFPHRMRNVATGQIVYAVPIARNSMLASGEWEDAPAWYQDPWILGGAAAVSGILVLGWLNTKKRRR
jgi:hypothetical protein